MLALRKGEPGRGLRAVLGFDSCLVEDFEVDALVGQCLTNLLHGRQLIDGLVGDDADALGAHVLKVHADLARDAGSETDGRSSHLKGILLELGTILRGCIAAYSRMWTTAVVVMVPWIRVAGT